MTRAPIANERLLITGGPRTGKTSIALQFASDRGLIARCTDSLIARFEWSAASEEVSRWLEEPGPWIIEGVAVPRALRKWLERHPTGTPADTIVWIESPKVDRSPGQVAMAKGVETVWRHVAPQLRRRGVVITGA